jgi:hypothetical protein
MISPFSTQLRKALTSVHPLAYDRLEELDRLPDSIADKVLGILLQSACQSQHIGNIKASREAIARIPRDWLRTALPRAIDTSLNIGDEWEYRRLLELLKELAPDLMPPLIDRGLASNDPDLHETAEDFSSVEAGKQP